jgi:hypothetical protein
MGASGHVHQTIMLLAEERMGSAPAPRKAGPPSTAPSQTSSSFPPERMLYCGLALGYPDREHPINSFRTEREPLEASPASAVFS